MEYVTAGDGYWGQPKGEKHQILGTIRLLPESDNQITIMHTGSWRVYTDSGFLAAARKVTGIADLSFTEQGMQRDGEASMEW